MRLLVFVLMLLMPTDPPLCRVLDTIGMGEVVAFDAAAYTWVGLPDDLRLARFIYLANPMLPDEQVQALMFEYSADRNELWLFPFWSLAWRDGGNHDLCAVRKLRLP